MNRIINLLLALAFVFTLSSASAQQPSKLGHIDMNVLIETMPETAKAKTTLEANAKEIESEMTNLNEQYRKAMAEFNEKMNTYSDVIRQTKEQEIRDLIQRVQTFQEMSQTNFDKTRNDLFQPIIDKANNAIKEVGKENGYTYIFNTSTQVMPYFTNGDDVLPLVKKKMGIL